MSGGREPADGAWDVARYEAGHSYVWNYGAALVELLAPRPGERVLDIGCGSGHLTAEIARSGADTLGVDSSPEMIAQARINFPGLRFALADAREFAAAAPFDAVFSNAALHWMKPAERAAAAIAGALRPGGRLVAEFGGKANVAAVLEGLAAALGAEVAAVRNPWYFPSLAEYACLLDEHGIDVTGAWLFPRPTRVEGEDGLREWLRMFAPKFFMGMSEPHAGAAFSAVEEALRDRLYRGGAWEIDYMRLRVTGHKREAGTGNDGRRCYLGDDRGVIS